MKDNVWAMIGAIAVIIGLVSAGSTGYLTVYAFPRVDGAVLKAEVNNIKEKVGEIKKSIDRQGDSIRELKDAQQEQRKKSERLYRSIERLIRSQKRDPMEEVR